MVSVVQILNFQVLKHFFLASLIALIYLSYITPMLYAYLNSELFIYVNGWDEETYLTYQGALGSLSEPGYLFSGAMTLLFQSLGLSGSDQNLIFDILLVPIIALVLYRALIDYVENKYFTAYLVIIVLFSSVLFNHSNPILHELYPVREIHFFMFGYESYPSILRTPNPQLSYLLVAISIWLFVKTRRLVFLLIPLPFVYFFVAIPYAYFLIIYLAYRVFGLKEHSIRSVVVLSLFAYLIISIGLIVVDFFFLSQSEIVANPKLYLPTHRFFFPIVAVVSLSLFGIQFLLYRKERQPILLNLISWQLYLFLSLIFMANVQVISGYMLSYKNYYDYGFSILGGLSIAVFVYSLYRSPFSKILSYIVVGFVCSLILYMVLISQGFNFTKWQYKIAVRGDVVSEDLDKIQSNSIYALIDDLDYRSKVAYANAKMISPPFSYQYAYPFFSTQCVYNEVLFNNANIYIEKNDLPESKFLFKHRLKGLEENVDSANSKLEQGYCNKKNYEKNDFFLVPVSRERYFKYYPDW